MTLYCCKTITTYFTKLQTRTQFALSISWLELQLLWDVILVFGVDCMLFAIGILHKYKRLSTTLSTISNDIDRQQHYWSTATLSLIIHVIDYNTHYQSTETATTSSNSYNKAGVLQQQHQPTVESTTCNSNTVNLQQQHYRLKFGFIFIWLFLVWVYFVVSVIPPIWFG